MAAGPKGGAGGISPQDHFGPGVDPAVAVGFDGLRIEQYRCRCLMGVAGEHFRQGCSLDGRKDPHVQGDVLLEGFTQHEIHQPAGHVGHFRALENAHELDLAKGRTGGQNGCRGAVKDLLLTVEDFGCRAAGIADHDGPGAALGPGELTVVGIRPAHGNVNIVGA
ncbi:hypothetical protein DESC_500102 [Desulfosarcina cetonica]|nr:hypothetical protein DESC_500102 [Desulfosarcina cetonica]